MIFEDTLLIIIPFMFEPIAYFKGEDGVPGFPGSDGFNGLRVRNRDFILAFITLLLCFIIYLFLTKNFSLFNVFSGQISTIFTSQGEPGQPGQKVIKCLPCHSGLFVGGETAELLKNYCL